MRNSIRLFILYTILLFMFFESCKTNEKIVNSSNNSSIFYNINNSEKDRVLLFDGKYFIWMYENQSDSVITAVFGKYYFKSDTVFFIEPDSTEKANRFFCFCKVGHETEKQFQLYSTDKNYLDKGFNYAYHQILKKKEPNYFKIEATRTFMAIKKDDILELIDNKSKYVLLK